MLTKLTITLQDAKQAKEVMEAAEDAGYPVCTYPTPYTIGIEDIPLHELEAVAKLLQSMVN